ncbi:MAG: CARDB domain-containing protein [Candidatus Korarchaeota archaeon]|nr:CARDB domain-containing protein [Candidatus Korarchaeota archaeon]
MRKSGLVLLILLSALMAAPSGTGTASEGLARLPTGACTLFCPISGYVKVWYVDLNASLAGSQRIARVGVGEEFEVYVEVWLKKTSSDAPMALILVGSWSNKWPPVRGAYVKIYEGIPSSTGSKYRLRTTMRAPQTPGNYSLWVMYVPPPREPGVDPVENLFKIWSETENLTGKAPWELPNCGPPHARVEVVAKPKITLTNFWVSKRQVSPGETVEFGVRANNVGTAEGTYEVEAKLDGSHLETKTGVLAPGQSRDLTWRVKLNQPGDHWIDVGGSFSAQIHVLEPGELKVKNLRASSSELMPGDTLKVYVTVENDGEMERDIQLALIVDGKVVDSKTVLIEPMSSKDVQFEVTLEKPGVHEVKVSKLGPLEVRVLSPGECRLLEVAVGNGTVFPGEVVNLTVTLSNVGDLETTCVVEVSVNGTVKTSEVVRIPGKGTKNVTLSFPTWAAGLYFVDVNGTELTVEAISPPSPEGEAEGGSGRLRVAAGVASLAAGGAVAAYVMVGRLRSSKSRHGLGARKTRRHKKRRPVGARRRSGLR